MRSESRLSSVVCYKHFKPDDLTRCLEVQEENGILLTPWLKRDEFGITTFSRIRAAVVASEKQQSVSGAKGGDRRMVTYFTEQMFSALIYQFPFLFNFLNKKYFLQALKAVVKQNVGSAAT